MKPNNEAVLREALELAKPFCQHNMLARIKVDSALAATATVAKDGELSKIDLDHQIKEAWTKDGRSGPTPWTFVREVTRILATPKAEASAEQPAGEVDWLMCELICSEDHVDEALNNFSQDITHENAVAVVQAAITVYLADTTRLATPISEDTRAAASRNAGVVPACFLPLVTVKYWADEFEKDPVKLAGGMIVRMCKEYAILRHQLATTAPDTSAPADSSSAAPSEGELTYDDIAKYIDRPGFALANLTAAEQRNLLMSISEIVAMVRPSPTGESLSARKATDWLEFVRRAKLIYNEGDEGMQALDYLLALVDTSITAADLAALAPTVPGEPT